MLNSKKCIHCKTYSNQPFITCVTSNGYEDFDLRKHFTNDFDYMNVQMQMCPHCFYSSNNISLNFFQKKYQQQQVNECCESKDYLQVADKFKNKSLLQKYILNSFIFEKHNCLIFTFEIFQSFLNVAWVCDDINEFEIAKKYRIKAIEYFNRHSNNEKQKFLLSNKKNVIILLDVLRRANQFENCFILASQFLKQLNENQMFMKMLELNIKLCQEKNNQIIQINQLYEMS